MLILGVNIPDGLDVEEGVLQTEEGVSLRGSHGGYIEIWGF
jgi:hypothetical protein